MKLSTFDKLLDFLNRLEQMHIHYTLSHHREQAVMVTVAVPGERWEIEFMHDGSVEVERFISSGDIKDEGALQELFSNYSDEQADEHPSIEENEIMMTA